MSDLKADITKILDSRKKAPDHQFISRRMANFSRNWRRCAIAGHSQIQISSRYVRPSGDAMFAAVSKLGGHKFRHSEEFPVSTEEVQRQITQ